MPDPLPWSERASHEWTVRTDTNSDLILMTRWCDEAGLDVVGQPAAWRDVARFVDRPAAWLILGILPNSTNKKGTA